MKSFHTIDPVAAYFKSATIPDSSRIGWGVTGMGDIDRDGIPDLATSLGRDTIGSTATSAIAVLFMNANGTVKASKRISSYTDSFNVQIPVGGAFAGRIANIGDLNGDGMTDMAVLDALDDDGGTDHGAVHILFLDTAATVIDYQKISDTQGGFTGSMAANSGFNGQVAEVGDMDGDGIQDIAVGANLSDDGGSVGSQRGALWILLMNRDGTAKDHRKYSRNASTWPGYSPGTSPLTSGANFGFGIAKLGDLDGDGYNDIAVSARSQGDNGRGRLYILFFNASGGIKAFQTIGPGNAGNLGGLKLVLTEQGGQFGWSLNNMGDLNGDGTTDLAIGLNMKADGYFHAGAVLIGYLKPNGTLQHEDLISQTTGTGDTPLGLHAETWFGESLSAIGDLDGDHVVDLLVSAPNFNPGSANRRGRLFILKLNAKPLRVMSITTQDATLTTAGKVKLDIQGGVRPYRLVWMDSIPTTAKLNTWKTTIDTAGFHAIGMPQVLPNTLTADQLIALHHLDTAAMPSGVFPLVVADAADSVRYRIVHIGQQLVQASLTGASIANGKDLTKTAATGWSSMRFTSKNRLPMEVDGWMRFIAPAIDQRIAVGLSQVDTAQVNGYEQMSFAFLLSSDSIWCWDGGTLHLIDRKFKAGDQFRIQRTADSVCYYLERSLLRIAYSANAGIEYMADAVAYQNGARIKQLTTGFPASFHVYANVSALEPLIPGGGVNFNLSPTPGTYTIDWLDGPDTSTDHDSIPPGHYEVDIASSFFGHTRRSVFDVGNFLYWSSFPVSMHDNHYGVGMILVRTDEEPFWEVATSLNAAGGPAEDHWTAFRSQTGPTGGALVGWRTQNNPEIWAAWWVHPFGQDMLANAVGSNGVITSVPIGKTDELRIQGHGTDSVRFLINGRVIASLERTANGPFQLIAGLRQNEDQVIDLATSIPVPLLLNTAQMIPGIPYRFTTPDNVETNAVTGSTAAMDLGIGPLTGDHLLEIDPTDSTDALTFRFELQEGFVDMPHGEVINMRLLVNDTTYQVDSSAYVLHPPNELAFLFGADEAPDTSAAAQPLYLVDLQDGLFLTPNGDSDHDLLQVLVNIPITSFEFTVLDRMDNILFQTTDPEASWNGRYMNSGDLQDDGVYRYLIQLDDLEDTGEFILKR